ncbi:N-acyl-L-homoserine lactone synthetase [Actibacterium mucosum KCTC 23349]|uniref:N-acyl-L-homoserine lactone synthetase n=1 Tax=Actibacterium mucosum KCTC 23349 TaxID=1454373 RepID=A0A037ZF96_9RHOB|nr:acyl-homoserine-lactone synthase [Actibacterium mucosum]KAJ54802.1 N-acyl-L-homoserine lactone synthetase [Actibacterium mucosum KCTC 23349]
MQTTTLSFANLHSHGELFANLLRARRESFIVERKWDLPEAMGMEYDQYDTPASRWIAVHDGGQILAGVRLTPTTTTCGIYSYMIRDAQRGLLDSIPKDLLEMDAPVDDHVWECTRAFVASKTPLQQRIQIYLELIGGMAKTSRELGATQVIALTPANWGLWMKRVGLKAKAIGRKVFIDDGDYQCVSLDLSDHLH